MTAIPLSQRISPKRLVYPPNTEASQHLVAFLLVGFRMADALKKCENQPTPALKEQTHPKNTENKSSGF